MITMLEFAENLTDRQAADAVGTYRLEILFGLALNPGFDFNVLSHFRTRFVAHDLQGMAFEILMHRLVQLGMVEVRGRLRTDATHVVAAVRDLNRLDMVLENLRTALEALAATAPQWLAVPHIDAEVIRRYGARIDEWRLPKEQASRQKLAVQGGWEGYRLLKAVADRRARRPESAADAERLAGNAVWSLRWTDGGAELSACRRTRGVPAGRRRPAGARCHLPDL